jgi:hypothetical protein
MDKGEIQIHLEKGRSIHVDYIEFQKMLLLLNAVNDGWTVKKEKDAYIFKKNHEGKREVFEESFLHSFMKDNFDINKLLK